MLTDLVTAASLVAFVAFLAFLALATVSTLFIDPRTSSGRRTRRRAGVR